MLADVPKLALEGKLDAEALGKAKAILERHRKALALIARGNQQPRTVFHVDWDEGAALSSHILPSCASWPECRRPRR